MCQKMLFSSDFLIFGAQGAKTGAWNKKKSIDMPSGPQNLCFPKIWRSYIENEKFQNFENFWKFFEKFWKP